jgi:hypothetical protein
MNINKSQKRDFKAFEALPGLYPSFSIAWLSICTYIEGNYPEEIAESGRIYSTEIHA